MKIKIGTQLIVSVKDYFENKLSSFSFVRGRSNRYIYLFLTINIVMLNKNNDYSVHYYVILFLNKSYKNITQTLLPQPQNKPKINKN